MEREPPAEYGHLLTMALQTEGVVSVDTRRYAAQKECGGRRRLRPRYMAWITCAGRGAQDRGQVADRNPKHRKTWAEKRTESQLHVWMGRWVIVLAGTERSQQTTFSRRTKDHSRLANTLPTQQRKWEAYAAAAAQHVHRVAVDATIIGPFASHATLRMG